MNGASFRNKSLKLETLSYNELEARLAALEDSLEGSRIARQANHLIISSTSSDDESELIHLLSSRSPGRIFNISLADHPFEISFGTLLTSSTEESLISQIIRIETSESDLKRVLSILRSLFLPGIPHQVYSLYSNTPPALLRSVSEISSLIFIDTNDTSPESMQRAAELITFGLDVVDIAWLRLHNLREVLWLAIERGFPEIASTPIKSISISKNFPGGVSKLYAGWLLSKLGLEPASYSEGAYYCHGHNDTSVLCSFTELGADILSIEIEGGSLIKVKDAGDKYQAVVSCSVETCVERDHGAASSFELLDHYLLVGSSTTNYRSSLAVVNELNELRQEFLGT